MQECMGLLRTTLKALDLMQPKLPDSLKLMLLHHCEQFNGYLFHPQQQERIFNPGRVTLFMNTVYRNWENIDKTLPIEEIFRRITQNVVRDSQTSPASATLSQVIKYPVAKILLNELLENQIIESETLPAIVSQEKLNERSQMISFM
jgi:hypothetical protein